ncbi:hypothetical protein BJ982_000825 [Sphaerisporangium siamense]|uniref:Uncharacterized protein n=1 Tax=Sphaerisporangium siamense TaxID=795645 RepID=A0A7W7G9T5_9ACTN|nr:hypothetical protein [Sphaerisporangium siamense]MBB4699281.1 hypothetical protein [Sphaerisporangium siamense]
MWWPRRRRPAPDPAPDPQITADESQRLAAARAARRQAERQLELARARRPEVEQIASSLRRVRERNGFAEIFANALRGTPGDPSAG